MVPRLIFAALVFCSLASRPEGAQPRRRALPDHRPIASQAMVGPAAAHPSCP